jgi:hypothetical protein
VCVCVCVHVCAIVSVWMCVCICVYVCVYVCMYVSVCVCVYVCMYVSVFVGVRMCVCESLFMCVCCVCECLCMCVCVVFTIFRNLVLNDMSTLLNSFLFLQFGISLDTFILFYIFSYFYSGSFSTIFSCVNNTPKELKTKFAVKKIDLKILTEIQIRNIEFEINVLSQLQRQGGLIALYSVYYHNSVIYMVSIIHCFNVLHLSPVMTKILKFFVPFHFSSLLLCQSYFLPTLLPHPIYFLFPHLSTHLSPPSQSVCSFKGFGVLGRRATVRRDLLPCNVHRRHRTLHRPTTCQVGVVCLYVFICVCVCVFVCVCVYVRVCM